VPIYVEPRVGHADTALDSYRQFSA
jgi:hypothetical protein